MRRDHLNSLKRWREDFIRVPLMIRGAQASRQIMACQYLWQGI